MVNKLSDEYECPIDVKLYNFINTHLHLYYNIGFTPNIVTTFSILFGILASHQIMIKQFKTGALFTFIAYYLDCVDGKLARRYNMITKFGDIYDHVGDIFKIIIITSALFLSNTKKTTTKQWIYIGVFLSFTMIQCVHLGYQEAIYNKSDESLILTMWRKLVEFDKTPEKTIHYTKYFGCGTWNICFVLLIIIWSK